MTATPRVDTEVATLVSVVVPTRGRPHLLNRCLRALVNQRMDPSCYEIIVVDAGRDESTYQVVMRWIAQTLGCGPLIGYLASPGPHGPAATRNKGWRAACGDVVAFTDDDTVPDRDWLLNGLMAFEKGVQAVSGRIVTPLPERPTDYELDAKSLERAEFVTANCFCLKHVLLAIGGFDERFPFAWREDTDLHFRLLRLGARIVHAPDAIVVHPVPPAPWGVSLGQQKKILVDALLYKKHPDLYRDRIRRAPRRDYYLIVAAMIAALSALAMGALPAAAAAGALWTMLTGRFAWQRLRGTSKSLRHIAEMIVTSALIPPLAVFWRLAGALKFRVAFL